MFWYNTEMMERRWPRFQPYMCGDVISIPFDLIFSYKKDRKEVGGTTFFVWERKKREAKAEIFHDKCIINVNSCPLSLPE